MPGLAGLNNFDIFLTLDKKLKHQQSIGKANLKFIVLPGTHNKHQTLQPYIKQVKGLVNLDPITKISGIT